MKNNRQGKILEIIVGAEIETQSQLMEELAKRGLTSTQATVSRDIKELRLVKELSPDGRYRYVIAGRDEHTDYDQRVRKIFREGVTSCDIAQNIIVLKTLPGLASGCCSALDGMSVPNLVGTIGGDDTAFIAMKTNEAAEQFCREIENMLQR